MHAKCCHTAALLPGTQYTRLPGPRQMSETTGIQVPSREYEHPYARVLPSSRRFSASLLAVSFKLSYKSSKTLFMGTKHHTDSRARTVSIQRPQQASATDGPLLRSVGLRMLTVGALAHLGHPWSQCIRKQEACPTLYFPSFRTSTASTKAP
ncbi:hypothetical protein C8Q70DRAFT_935677 [Cubamyces menziesii]|nr:hypothetical protein C8Q70DRAFT_935677 [Cubamyces menziesii]